MDPVHRSRCTDLRFGACQVVCVRTTVSIVHSKSARITLLPTSTMVMRPEKLPGLEGLGLGCRLVTLMSISTTRTDRLALCSTVPLSLVPVPRMKMPMPMKTGDPLRPTSKSSSGTRATTLFLRT
jgi:hypothetical protein